MSKGRILVVDDNPMNLKLICSTLRFAGHELTTAQDAEAAQETIDRSGPFDLILMDVSLPGMDGLELTRRLKTSDRTRNIPIVILTASAMKGDDQRAMDSGADGYITKPIDTRLFPRQVETYLKQAPDGAG